MEENVSIKLLKEMEKHIQREALDPTQTGSGMILDICVILLHIVFPEHTDILPNKTRNPFKQLDTPQALKLYLTDAVKYGLKANKKRATIFIMGNTKTGKTSLVNTFKEYVEKPHEEPKPKLTQDHEELLETQILDLYGDISLQPKEKLKLNVRTTLDQDEVEGVKLISIERDHDEQLSQSKLPNLDLKVVDFGGHTEYYTSMSLFTDSNGLFVICINSREFLAENAEAKYLSLVGTYIDLVSESSFNSEESPKLLIVATKVTPERSCDDACAKMLELTKAHLATRSNMTQMLP